MPAGERTEQATPHKRQEARKKGQVAKSIELNAAIGLLVSLFGLRVLGNGIINQWHNIADAHIKRAGNFELTATSLQSLAQGTMLDFGKLVLPLLALCVVTSMVSNFMQGGFMLSATPLIPDFSRVNPLQGFTRLFSVRTMAELAKSSIKALLVGYQVYAFFRDNLERIIALVAMNARDLGPTIFNLCWSLLTRVLIIMIVIAVSDYAFQRWQFEKSLRMTKEEIKEEVKSTEGNPLTKQRTRQRQREIARNRMLADVPTATVVITNPTHFAVALKYVPGEMSAPQVVAKGQRLIAQKIKEIAKEHGVPIMENRPLARALFDQCEVGSVIPVELYQAVAEMIAFVFRQSGRAPR